MDDGELQRLRGRMEALLIKAGEEAGQLAAMLGTPPDPPNAPALNKLDHLAGLVRDNAAFSEIAHLAGEGRRLLALYQAQPPTVEVAVRQMIEGAAAVAGGLERTRLTLAANALANQKLAGMQQQTGGQPQLSFDQQMAMWSNEIERQKIISDSSKALLDAVITFAGAAVRGLLLLNGGAAVAMLAFVGHVVTAPSGSMDYVERLVPALLRFGCGAAAAVAVAMLSYLGQVSFHLHYHKEDKASRIIAEIFRVAAILTATGSLVAFGWGLHLAVGAFFPSATP